MAGDPDITAPAGAARNPTASRAQRRPAQVMIEQSQRAGQDFEALMVGNNRPSEIARVRDRNTVRPPALCKGVEKMRMNLRDFESELRMGCRALVRQHLRTAAAGVKATAHSLMAVVRRDHKKPAQKSWARVENLRLEGRRMGKDLATLAVESREVEGGGRTALPLRALRSTLPLAVRWGAR